MQTQTESIGPYQIVDRLGEGGMGVVYRAHDPRFHRDVALKVLHAQLAREPDICERFRTEAVIQAKLLHPGVVRVYDFVDDGERLAMVLQLVDGLPLDEWMQRHPLPSSDWVVDVVAQVLDALAYAHLQGLVHRDMKPSNVMVEVAEGKTIARVVDFGIAKVLGAEKLRTATSAKMGTLAYMSPEQLRSPRGVDHRTDVYAIGMLLYELLTGDVAFAGDTEYEVMQRIIEVQPTRRSLRVAAPAPILDVALRALEKDPQRRFAGCVEMKAALLAAALGTALPSPISAARAAAPLPPAVAARPVTASPIVQPLAPSPATPRSAASAYPRRKPPWAAGAVAAGATVLAILVLWSIAGNSSPSVPVQQSSPAAPQASIATDQPGSASDAMTSQVAAEQERQLELESQTMVLGGLRWMRRDNGHDVSWRTAQRYCAALEIGGTRSWRLPTIDELARLSQPSSRRWQVADGIHLTACCPWSSTEEGSDQAWTFVFDAGERFPLRRTGHAGGRALCVHDG